MGEPFHRTGGQCGFGASRCCPALGLQLFVPLASEFIGAPTVHVGIEHFQSPAAGVDLVVMGEIGVSKPAIMMVRVEMSAEDANCLIRAGWIKLAEWSAGEAA